MATQMTQIIVTANPDLDDCLQGAVDAYVVEHPEAAGWDLSPRWTDETRETVTLTVPAFSETPLLDAIRAGATADDLERMSGN